MIRYLTLCALIFAACGTLSAEEKPAVVPVVPAAEVPAEGPAVAPAVVTPAVPGEAPAVPRLTTDQWCAKHDIPKNVCGACDRKLIPGLKKNNDWCAEHALPESVCVKCDPTAKERLDAQRPVATPAAAK